MPVEKRRSTRARRFPVRAQPSRPGLSTVAPDKSGLNKRRAAAVVVTTGLLLPGIAAAQSYEVEPGDTLSTIAARSGLDPTTLALSNQLDDANQILPGTELDLPASGVGLEHRVAPGETVWDIATRYGVPLESISHGNGLAEPGLVLEGEVLAVPAASVGAVVAASSETAPAPAPAASQTATVASAASQTATVASAASQTATAAAAQAAPANGNDGATAAGTGTHTVAAGETLWDIAMKNGISIDALLGANGMSLDSLILPGDSLVIDGAAAAVTTAVAVTAGPDAGLPTILLKSPHKLGLAADFEHWAAEYELPADLLKALAWFESGWDNNSRSSAGAIGIGQLLPITADFVSEQLLESDLNPFDPQQNIQLSARYLRYLLDHTGDEDRAVAAYYQGLTAVREQGIFPGTRAYVDGVQSLRARFR